MKTEMNTSNMQDQVVPAIGNSETVQKKDDDMNKSIMMVGNCQVDHWLCEEPPVVEGAMLLGYLKSGRHEYALFELKNGDFCDLNTGAAQHIPRRDFPQFFADMGCPWEISDEQLEHIQDQIEKIQAEFNIRVY